MEEKNVTSQHKVYINNRSNTTMTGIAEVISFDDKQIVLDTVQGRLSIYGAGLKVDKLTIDNGEAVIAGKICKMEYTDSKEVNAGSILSRLFR